MKYVEIGNGFGVWVSPDGADLTDEVEKHGKEELLAALTHNTGVLAIAMATTTPASFRQGVFRDTTEVSAEDPPEKLREAGIEVEG